MVEPGVEPQGSGGHFSEQIRFTSQAPLRLLQLQKQFRKPFADAAGVSAREAGDTEQPHLCPECKRPMLDMGRYFRPPRRNDERTWRQLALLAEHGFRFRSEGAVVWARFVQGHTTGRLDAEQLIANCSSQSRTEGQRLLRTIALRRRDGRGS